MRVNPLNEDLMWLLTPFGFFSVVNKPGDPHLTVRSRVRADLDALRRWCMNTQPASAVGPMVRWWE
jgi:hypothetical protein